MAGTDVFEIWLEPIITEYGWPFISLSDSITGTGWEEVLTYQPLNKISQLHWHRTETAFSLSLFTPQTESTISALFESHICGFHNSALKRVKNSRERFMRCYEFTKLSGRVPRECVLLADESGYAVFDGNHRLGAMWAVASETNIPCVLDAWVGSLPNGTNVWYQL